MKSLALLIVCALLPCAALAGNSGYGYPIEDPYLATVQGTPRALEYPLPASVGAETWELEVAGRRVPDIFWYAGALSFSVALQPVPAPLVFIISGTGGGHDSAKTLALQRAFYGAGFHAVCLPSPTYISFIVGASRSHVPGYVPDDVEDLYGSMRSIVDALRKRAAITDICLTGYSLGGLHAAFLARMDAERGAIGFRKTLLINPPVSLITSVVLLDNLLTDKALGGEDPFDIVNRLVGQFSELYKRQERVELSENFLYAIVRDLGLSRRELYAVIGASFRFSAMNMVFASDVCTGAGYIVPRGHRVTVVEPLSPYLDAAVRVSFQNYFDEYLVPFVQHREPSVTPEEILFRCSLESIREWLTGAANVSMVSNEDEIILTAMDKTFLKGVFGQRATFYPRGGHCGNLLYGENVTRMLDYFRR